MELPKRLYKYQSISSMQPLKNLQRNCIYFNDPNNFNDPYDINHPIGFENINTKIIQRFIHIAAPPNEAQLVKLSDKLEEDSLSEEELIEFTIQCSSFLEPFYGQLLVNLGLDVKDIPTDIVSKIKDQRLNFEKVNEAVKQSLFSWITKMIDNALETQRREVFKNNGIACFSKKFDHILMWSHYSDGHRGFCLEFDTSYQPFNNSHIYRVKYKKSLRVNINKFFFEENRDDYIIQSCLAAKYTDWKYEKEWRVISKEKNKEYRYEPNALSGVYFGEKIDPTNLEIISQIVKGQNPNVKLYKMQKNPREFKMMRQEIN